MSNTPVRRLGLEAESIELVGDRARAVAPVRARRRAAGRLVSGYWLPVARTSCCCSRRIFRATSVGIETLRDALCARPEAPHTAGVDKLLEHLRDSGGRRPRARRALLEEQIGSRRIGTLWQLRVRPGSSFTRQARDAGLGSRLLLLCPAHVGEYALWLLAWWALGVSALEGRADRGLLIAWSSCC